MKTTVNCFRKNYECERGVRQKASYRLTGHRGSYVTYRSRKALGLQKWRRSPAYRSLETGTGTSQSRPFLLTGNLGGPLWSSSRQPPSKRGERACLSPLRATWRDAQPPSRPPPTSLADAEPQPRTLPGRGGCLWALLRTHSRFTVSPRVRSTHKLSPQSSGVMLLPSKRWKHS